MKEIWKQYNDTNYEVSNMGKVRNKETKKEIKPYKKDKQEHSYMHIGIQINGKRKQKKVHRLVMETFLGESDLEIDHINGIRDDNRLENLEYVAREENYQRYIKNGGNNERKPVKATSLDGLETLEFKSLWQAGRYLKNKRKKSKIEHYCTNIKQNIVGKTKYAYGYVWEHIDNSE